MIHCGKCKFFLNEDIDGYGYCKLSNKERRCSQLCEGLEYERKIERKQQMNNPDLHTALLFLMIKLEDIKNNPMQDKHFVAALTEVLRFFRDNGELTMNMETKEFKVSIPEGYEIDTGNSAFECIKFKPTTNPTYEDIARSLFKDGLAYYINGHGVIIDAAVNTGSSVSDSNNATNRIQLARLLAMNQLLNIVEYYNQKREEASSGYIMLRGNDGKLHTTDIDRDSMSLQAPFFYSREDAESVINNPNFTGMLDLVYL